MVLDHNASSLLMLGQRWKSAPLSKVITMMRARKVKVYSSFFWVRIIVESESLKYVVAMIDNVALRSGCFGWEGK